MSMIMKAEEARARSIKVMEEKFPVDDLEHLDERIAQATDEMRFGINIRMQDELPGIESHSMKRLLIEYLRLHNYNAFYVDNILEIRWQI
ncbi:hypothetical protein [Vibrio phage XZ1]|nr:hypothetical protein AVU32_gp213 [Vibrio phage ValKK3]ALP47237.1 hypothetical protein phiGrn1_0163 [Vibrio phage phi-Grn1]QBX06040.1 hypothetical protein Va3_086 [Vibrio phage Va3]QNJ54665.1 hypothetical protein vBValMR10Z_124 [Vibrio phage vB_ValM_R10Z]QNJ55051.1 hypothetical protein vBValMR11Z_125 [Vibrio phage vB_ValM_R11Z]UOL51441.1 hypothetical protein [Vibrio phage XZ1]URQ03633.1 hypothetical protein PVA23_256 [Vibrio phage PVA23]